MLRSTRSILVRGPPIYKQNQRAEPATRMALRKRFQTESRPALTAFPRVTPVLPALIEAQVSGSSAARFPAETSGTSWLATRHTILCESVQRDWASTSAKRTVCRATRLILLAQKWPCARATVLAATRIGGNKHDSSWKRQDGHVGHKPAWRAHKERNPTEDKGVCSDGSHFAITGDCALQRPRGYRHCPATIPTQSTPGIH